MTEDQSMNYEITIQVKRGNESVSERIEICPETLVYGKTPTLDALAKMVENTMLRLKREPWGDDSTTVVCRTST